MSKCSNPNCTDPTESRGLCKRHYNAWHKQHRCNAPACNRLALDNDYCEDHEQGDCKVHGCTTLGSIRNNGLCQNHYEIWETHNNPNGTSRHFKGLGVLLCVTCKQPYTKHDGWPCPVWKNARREELGLAADPYTN